jgi:hypothetical protein
LFKTAIQSTPLTSDAANKYFENTITGQHWQRDYTFLATLRALLEPRMKDGENLYLSFNSSQYSDNDCRNTEQKRAVRAIVDDYPTYQGSLRIHTFSNSSQASNYAWLELMKSTFESVYPGWHRVDKVTQFFRKVFYVLCFINPELKSVILFTEDMDMRKMHYLQCGMPAYLPWYFQSDDGEIHVSEIEMALIDSLRQKTQNAYEDCISKIAEKYDFNTIRIRQLLAGFESRYERLRCDKVQNDIEYVVDRLNSLNAEIADYLRQQRDLQIQLLGLEAKIAQTGEDSEIMEYFLCNKHLSLENVTDTTMRFVVKDYLTYFDEDMAQRILDNPSSYIYKPNGRACNNYILAEDMKLLMTAVFLEQTIKLRVCAAYEFRLEGNVSPLGGYTYGSDYREYMPNMHIDKFRCMGNYSRTINQLLADHNYIGAIEQCIASCKSLNFGDSPVMSEFARQIYGLSERGAVNVRCFELPDGRVVTPKEAIAYLKEGTEANG